MTSEPIAWAVYGGKTGILRYVERDEDLVRSLVDDGGYVARPLVVATDPSTPEESVTHADEMPDGFAAALGELVVDSEGDGINHVRHITLRDVLGPLILADVANEAWTLARERRS